MGRLSKGVAWIFTVLACLTAPWPGWAGTQASFRFVGPGDSPSAPPGLFLFLQGSKARLDIQTPPWNASLLYNRSTQDLTVLDHVSRSYDEYGSTKRKVLRGSLGLALRVNDLRLKNGPEPDQKLRDRLAEVIRIGFNASFRKTHQKGRFEKWATDRYMAQDGQVTLEVSTVPRASAIPVAEEWATWKELLQVLMETGQGGLVYFGADESKLAGWPRFQGFPVFLNWKKGSKSVYRLSAVTLESKVLRPDMFSPPEGYKPQSVMDYLKPQ